MIRILRFSPSRVALGFIALSLMALALFAVPLWYGWYTNVSTFRAYVQEEKMQRLLDVLNRDGAKGLAEIVESQARNLPNDEVLVLADPSKVRMAGNLPAWPPQVPDAPGMYGVGIFTASGATMRFVGSHTILPGGYHLLAGRESARFDSLVGIFWFGIAGVVFIVVALGSGIGWAFRRAMLAEQAGDRFALAMEAAGDGHTDWVIPTDQFYASPRALEICGMPPGTTFAGRAEWIERFPFHPEDRAAWERAVNEHLAHGSGRFEMEMRILPGGLVRWIKIAAICSRDATGKPVRWSGYIADVTDRKNLEKKLRQSQRLEAMGTLAGGIAHDFNNILAAILGYGEMALRDAPKDGRLRRDLDSITVAGERGRALVERILAFSRSGVSERVAVHVERVVRESIDLLTAKLPPGITIKPELRAGRAAMQGDATQIHQVFMNLATNGVQAMASGGTLRVSLDEENLDSPRIVTTGTLAAGHYIVLKVSDAGTGIPAEILEHIFEPFFTTKEVGVGTGLGLSLVHGIVSEVDGAIDVATTLGSGSTFSVYLPRSGDATDEPMDETKDMPRGERQRVLVVDDEEPLVRLATRTLEDLGYAPKGFTSSVAALDAFRSDPNAYDAVITDERMPGLSGSALIREVRGIRRSIPILLVSGYLGGQVVDRAYNSGADEVLQKPLSARSLAVSLARVLQPRQPAASGVQASLP